MREWLRNARIAKKLTQEEVATRASLSRAFYTQIEQGSRNPSFQAASKIAKVLGISPSAFFLRDINDPFVAAFQCAKIKLALVDKDLKYTWIFNPHPDFDEKISLGKTAVEVSDNQGTQELMALKRTVIDQGHELKKKITIPFSDGYHSYMVFLKPQLDDDGTIIGCISVSMDISELL